MIRQTIPLWAAALAIAACQPTESASRDTAGLPGDSAPAGESAAAAAAAPTGGVDTRTRITGDGIGELRVGAAVESVARSCRVMRDTTVPGIEGTQERRIVVDLGRDTVSAVIDSNRVWRLHVRTPAFRTSDSLGVGTLASALRRPGAKVLIGEGAIFVTLPSHCGLSFRLRGVEFGRVRTLAQIPGSASVDEVLAIGCRGGSSDRESS